MPLVDVTPFAPAATVATMRRRIVYLADYVTGDGSDETAALQAAVTAAAGGTLVCAPDLTVGYSAPITVLSDTTIEGGATFRQVDGNTNTTYPQAAFSAVGREGVIIRGFTIDANYENAPGALHNGVFFYNTTHSRIEGITLVNVERTGLYIYHGCEDVVVEKNTVTGRPGLGGSDTNSLITVGSLIYGTNGTNGLKAEDGTVAFDTTNALAPATRHVRVRDNLLTGGTHGVNLINVELVTVSGNDCIENAHRGIILSNSTSCIIANNAVSDAGSSGIHMAWGCYHNTITGNVISTVTGGEGDGIKGYYDIRYNTIANNTILDPATHGIRLAVYALGNVIQGNTIHSASQDGIRLTGYLDPVVGYETPTGSFPTRHNTVMGNFISNSLVGVNLTDGGFTGTTIQRNTVALNSAVSCTTGFASSATAYVLDNASFLNAPFDAVTPFNHGQNTNRYFSLFNGDLGTKFPTLTAFALANTSNESAKKITNGATAPASGTWAVGDIVFNTAPAAGGTVGWVCTTAGTPGTWKTFGSIAP